MRVWTVLQFFVILMALPGCYADPFQNPGSWAMTGASRSNIAVQSGAPSQLITIRMAWLRPPRSIRRWGGRAAPPQGCRRHRRLHR